MYPASDYPELVGSYPKKAGAGGGVVYDEILEYRVWNNKNCLVNSFNYDEYQKHINNTVSKEEYLKNKDIYDKFPDFKAFATYEEALDCYNSDPVGQQAPLVLILQKECISETESGEYVHIKQNRVTEWQPQWLIGKKREPGMIEKLIADFTARDAKKKCKTKRK